MRIQVNKIKLSVLSIFFSSWKRDITFHDNFLKSLHTIGCRTSNQDRSPKTCVRALILT
mgnify:CR=1 FL=1